MKTRWLIAVAMLALAGNGESESEDMRGAYKLMAQAREAARKDENQKAADLFADLLKDFPTLRPELLREYADQLLYSGHAPESIPLFRETLARPNLLDLDAQRARRNLALALLWSGRHEEAVAAYRDAIRLAPSDADLRKNYVEALVGAARDAARQDRNELSASRFEEAIDLAPGRRRELLREYADQLTYSDRAARAVPLFREVLRFPDLSDDEAMAALRNLALALLWSGQPDESIAAYDQALARVPDDPDLRRNRVEAIVAAARHAASLDRNAVAAKRFGEAIQAAPERRQEFLREYADQVTWAGNPAAAVNLYRELIAAELMVRDEPSPDLLKALGLAHLWAGQHEAAKTAYESALALGASDPDTRRNLAEALVGLARHAAGAGRNDEAAELLRRAIETSPEYRADWVREYADQLTYSQRASDAVPFYERLLSDPKLGAAERAEVRMSLALARSWSGSLAEALSDYDAILRDDPGNRLARLRRAEVWQWQERHDLAVEELRRMHETAPEDLEIRRRLARVESYVGNYSRAIELAESVLKEDRADAEAAVILAESQLWMGRQDLAVETLTGFLQGNPGNERAGTLLKRITRDERPRTELDVTGSGQSDDLAIASAGIRQSFGFNGGRTRLGPQVRLIRYDPNGGPGVDVARVGGFIVHRFSDSVSVNSSMFVDFQEGARDHAIFTHDSWLTLLPADAWRIDLGLSRATLDNITSLNLGLFVDTVSGSVDYWPTETTKVTGRGSWSRYSDGNRRWLAQGEVRQRINHAPDVWVGARATTFEFARELNNGYFNPESLRSVESIAEVSGKLSERTSFSAHGTAGYEDARPGEGKFVWSAGLTVSHQLNETVALEAHAGHFSSALGSDSGFERTSVGVGVNIQW